MIVKHYDFGWGNEWPAKQLEHQLLKKYLKPVIESSTRWAVVNSTWYGDQEHHNTVEDMQHNQIESVILVSMLDDAIPRLDWFSLPAYGVGYYPGENEIDFWALLLEKYFQDRASTDAALIDTAFMCLNRKPHPHRLRLYRQLESQNLLDCGLVSLGSNNGVAVRTIDNDQGGCDLAPNAGTEQNGIVNDLVTLGNIENWNRCFINIVTETVFEIKQKHFVSEKIYKPILGMRPFLVYATDGGVDWLENRGFYTFVQDFRDITDLDLSDPNNISLFLDALTNQSQNYLQTKYQELLPKIEHNYQNFYRHCQTQLDKVEKGIKLI